MNKKQKVGGIGKTEGRETIGTMRSEMTKIETAWAVFELAGADSSCASQQHSEAIDEFWATVSKGLNIMSLAVTRAVYKVGFLAAK